MKFELVNIYKDDICESECSSNVYFTSGETVERKEREFIPNLILYRYHDCYYMNKIQLQKFRVIRETESSYLLIDDDKERWVRKNATRSFAYDKKEDAWRNFKKRKEKHLKILKSQINRVEQVISTITKIEDKQKENNEKTNRIYR